MFDNYNCTIMPLSEEEEDYDIYSGNGKSYLIKNGVLIYEIMGYMDAENKKVTISDDSILIEDEEISKKHIENLEDEVKYEGQWICLARLCGTLGGMMGNEKNFDIKQRTYSRNLIAKVIINK